MSSFQSRYAAGQQVWLTVAAAGSVVIMFFCALIYWQVGFQNFGFARFGFHDDRRTQDRDDFVPFATTQAGQASRSDESGEAGTNEFFRDAARLSDDAGHFRGETPEEVLRRVRTENAARGIDVCPFDWDVSGAKLRFSGEHGPVELDTVMGRCADAVEKTLPRR